MSTRLHQAIEFATYFHAGQDRKYTGLPYITHPLAVMEIVRSVTDDEDMLAAAVLHDVIEDTEATHAMLAKRFNVNVCQMVEDLTDISTPKDGNRAERKLMDLKYIAGAWHKSKTIKLADLIHNSQSITQYDTGFASVYMPEKRALLEVLRDGDRMLWNRANDIVLDWFDSKGSPVKDDSTVDWVDES